MMHLWTAEDIWRDVEQIRREAPLVHNITNYVAMNNSANALLAIGASPVMAHAIEEVEEMTGLASAVVINIGTLSEHWIAAMERTAAAARKKNIPLVLDPVGAGATVFRTETALRLLSLGHPAIVRGNASEILALARRPGSTKGVDSSHQAEDARDAAAQLSDQYDCVVSVSGAVDLIVDRDSAVRVANGHPMMSRVTALGCTASALTGAFAAVNRSPLHAAVHAMAVTGIAGEMAAARAEGPGSLQVRFLDALYTMNAQDLAGHLRIDIE